MPITLTYFDESGHYIYYSERGRFSYEQCLARVLQIERVLKQDFQFIVEATGIGRSLAYALISAGKKCLHYLPTFGKMSRAYAALPIIAAGRLYIFKHDDPRRNAWIQPYVNELLLFPHAHHDDQVDSLIQLLPWAEARVNPHGDYVAPYLADRYREVR